MIPPTTTMTKTMAATISSQRASARGCGDGEEEAGIARALCPAARPNERGLTVTDIRVGNWVGDVSGKAYILVERGKDD